MAGLIIQGDEEANDLAVKVVREQNGAISIYNIIYAGAGNDTLSGNAGAEDETIMMEYGVQLFGEDGDDTISDSGGNDTLSGGDGDDVISYFSGRDKIDGGEGFDSLHLHAHYPSLNQLKFTGVEELVLYSAETYVENFDLDTIDVIRSGSQYSKSLIFSKQANITDLAFLGNGAFGLSGAGFDDLFDVSESTAKIRADGRKGDDTIFAGRNNDSLTGGYGDDFLQGGKGDDALYGGVGNDTLAGGEGDDVIFTGGGDDIVRGGDGADVISGRDTRFSPAFTREEDIKVVSGGAGDDVFKDFRFYPTIKNRFLGGEGTDEITLGGNVASIVVKDVEIARITGVSITADPDVLDGFDQFAGMKKHMEFVFSSGGHFTWKAAPGEPRQGSIVGSGRADYVDMTASQNAWSISGGDGNDVLTAGKGYNVFAGEAGHDTFIFGTKVGATEILDFAGGAGDVIDLSAVRSIRNFDDMIDHHVKMSSDGDWLLIQFEKSEIRLYHAEVKDLEQSAFVF